MLDRLSGGESVRVTELAAAGARRPSGPSRQGDGSVRSLSRERPRRIDVAYAPARVSPAQRHRRLGRSRRGADALDYLAALGRPATTAEIRSETGAGPAILRTLSTRGLLVAFEQESRPEAGGWPAADGPPGRLIALTAEQAAAEGRLPRRSATAGPWRRCWRV